MKDSGARSEKRVIESLIDLMQIKKIDDISISEISENAEISRRTFYRNFSSKENVLDGYFETIFKDIRQRIDKLGDDIDCLSSLRIIFKLCYEHKDFFTALSKSNMLGFMLQKWNTALPILHSLFIDRIKKFPQTKDENALQYLLAFNVGGTFNMVLKWIDEGMAIPPDEMADIVEDFAFGTLIDINS